MSDRSTKRVSALKTRYRESGLIKLDTWVPPEHAAAILEECRLLRVRYLAERQALANKGSDK